MTLTVAWKVHADRGLIGPIDALFAAQDHAADIIAPPYDVVTTEEARTLAAGKPANFLHVSRAEIDFPLGTDAHEPEVYTRAAKNFFTLIENGSLIRTDRPSYFVYRIEMANHTQTGLACGASIAAYESGQIKRHELTRIDKENDRVAHMAALGAQTGPVLLAHRPESALAVLLEEIAGRSAGPDIDTRLLGGVRHILWHIDDTDGIAQIDAAAAALDTLYIADGHHRSAAAARDAEARNNTGERFLAVLFPSDQLHILAYNRIVRDLVGMDEAVFLAHLEADYVITLADAPVRPESTGLIGLSLPSGWRLLAPRHPLAADTPVLEQLDVARLTKTILQSILAIGDLRTDARLDFVGGADAPERIATLVAAGEAAAGFTLFPTRSEQLMAVSDAGEIMPPKSTWFEPKLADGLIAHVIA